MTPSRAAGFTLLETLVALLVLAFVVVGLAQALRFGLSAWDRQAIVIDRDGALDATGRTLRTLIAGMAPGTDPHAPTIIGDAARLAFTAELPAGAPATPIRLADVAIGTDDQHRLVLRWTTHLHAQVLRPATPHEAILLPGVAAIGFVYFSPAAGWVSTWRSIDPPELVRIHIGFADTGRHWPDVIVATMRRRDDE